jgi:hypothetical protein
MESFPIILLIIFLYFVPTFFAAIRKHKNAFPVFLANLIFGWTLIGWGVALIWSFSDNTKALR